MDVGAAVTTRLGDQSAGMGRVYPLTWRQDKAVEFSPAFIPLEFDGFETDDIQALGSPQSSSV